MSARKQILLLAVALLLLEAAVMLILYRDWLRDGEIELLSERLDRFGRTLLVEERASAGPLADLLEAGSNGELDARAKARL